MYNSSLLNTSISNNKSILFLKLMPGFRAKFLVFDLSVITKYFTS